MKIAKIVVFAINALEDCNIDARCSLSTGGGKSWNIEVTYENELDESTFENLITLAILTA
jgi:hypothetical protein